jgi:hypothetical protein
MLSLYTDLLFNNSKSNDLLPLECKNCKNTFYKRKELIKRFLNHTTHKTFDYCSIKCQKYFEGGFKIILCKNCNHKFKKIDSKIKKSPNHFCSRSCSATYNNKHKIHGTRRSKLEYWIEEQLAQLYPSIHMDFNQKSTIKSELDIYIPSLNLAFELNGIFHYEPIYGVNKLQQIQENDISKSKACHEAKIDLCTIDTSGQKYFKESTSQKYLDIINNIIKERLLIS